MLLRKMTVDPFRWSQFPDLIVHECDIEDLSPEADICDDAISSK
jgi:hypothetical protein